MIKPRRKRTMTCDKNGEGEDHLKEEFAKLLDKSKDMEPGKELKESWDTIVAECEQLVASPDEGMQKLGRQILDQVQESVVLRCQMGGLQYEMATLKAKSHTDGGNQNLQSPAGGGAGTSGHEGNDDPKSDESDFETNWNLLENLVKRCLGPDDEGSPAAMVLAACRENLESARVSAVSETEMEGVVKRFLGENDANQLFSLLVDAREAMRVMATTQIKIDRKTSQYAAMMSSTAGATSITTTTKQQKSIVRSSREAEMAAVADMMPLALWTADFMKGQGYEVANNAIFMDNDGAMIPLENNGGGSIGKRKKKNSSA